MLTTKRVGIIAGTVMVIIYLLLHITTVEYNGSQVRVFTLAPLFSSYGDCITLQEGVFQSPYGSITVKAFTMIEFRGGGYIGSLKNPKRVSHNLVIDGIEINQNAEIYFEYREKADRLRVISVKQPIVLGGMTLNIDNIIFNDVRLKSNPDFRTDYYFLMEDPPDSIEFSDGTMLTTFDEYSEKPETRLALSKENDIWYL
ncbi:MAG: hypothetical protein LBI85_00655, partial [Spirochaetaceae bacterium]|nr:hypothetical protein [Spirochaetaceae bacterium]